MSGDYRDYLIGFLYGKLKQFVKQHTYSPRGPYESEPELTEEKARENILFREIENAMQLYLQPFYPEPKLQDRRRDHD